MFADDTSVLVTSKDMNECINKLDYVLNSMSNWFKANKLSVNLDKTKVIKFLTQRSPETLIEIGIHDNLLEHNSVIKFLGLQVDEHLDWK